MLFESYILNNFNFTAELGDFDEENHTLAGISEFRFVPDQTEELEIQIFEEFKKYRYLFII